MKYRSVSLRGGIALGTLMLAAGSAEAQSVPKAQAEAQSEDSGPGLEEVVVTAQRRAERQQDVPVTISTLTALAAERAGASGTDSLTVAVPGLSFGRQVQNGGLIFLRGVGTNQAAQGAQSSVAMYVDDVYIGSPAATIFNFNNIDQIAVLKGPQGTLFGRNATGGVIQVTTRRPSQDPALDVSVGYGNYDTSTASLYATGGLTDTLAANIALASQDQNDGYGRNTVTGADIWKMESYGARGEVLWEPTPAASLLLIGDYSWSKGDLGMNTLPTPGTVTAGGGRYQGRYSSSNFPLDFAEVEQYGVSARLDVDLAKVTLASISAYRRNTLDFRIDPDNGPPQILSVFGKATNQSFSQEVQLASPNDAAIRWLAGVYYFYEEAGYEPLASAGPAVGGRSDLIDHQTLNSYSAFGDVSAEVLPDTRITGGLRYTIDRFENSARQTNPAGALINATPFTESSSFPKWTYRAVVDHKLNQDILLFVSYSRGFKSGGYNTTAPTVSVGGVAQPAPAVSPEILDAYEIGLKSEFFDQKLRVNLSAFYYDYTNLQVTILGSGATSTTVNAAAARVRGFDAEFEAAVTRHLNLTTGFEVLDSEFTQFPNGPYYVGRPATCIPTPTTTGTPTGGNAACAVDLSGYRTPRAPKFTANLGATYTIPSAVGDFSVNASYYYNSGFVFDADNVLRQPAYDLVSASIKWTSRDDRFDAKLWAKNLTDAYYYSYGAQSGTGSKLVPDMPRSYGVTFGAHF